MLIQLEIKSCKECPFWSPGMEYSMDGWDSGNDWNCKKADRSIAQFVEWHEVSKIEIPTWCPLKVEITQK